MQIVKKNLTAHRNLQNAKKKIINNKIKSYTQDFSGTGKIYFIKVILFICYFVLGFI